VSGHPDTVLHHISGPCRGCGMTRIGLQVVDAPLQRAATGGIVTEFWFQPATLQNAAAWLSQVTASPDRMGYCRTCAVQSDKSGGIPQVDGSSRDDGQPL
jgi:hypothetical protein